MAYARKRPMYQPPVKTEPVKPAYAPSRYQTAILEWLTTSYGNALVQARAGSGKTSTLVMLANAIPDTSSATFLAFNKSIATELASRLPSHVSSSTFHSLTGNAVKRYAESVLRTRLDWKSWTDTYKVENIFDAAYPDMMAVRPSVKKLVSLMKAHAMMPDADSDALAALMDHFDIESEDVNVSNDDIISMARNILRTNNADLRTVDFDDMLYFVIVHDVKLQTYDYVMVDESQDTNEVQRAIVRRLLTPRSRLIAVGDDAQAIYGFRGASSNSMELIRTEFECVTLPLSISYRCPSSVIQLAQAFVPDIEARENAPDGTVLYPETWRLADFAPSDLIVCRNTAPLIRTAYKMISARMPCRVMGREIGKGLTNLIKKLSGKRGTLTELPDKLNAYRDREVQAAMAKRQEMKAQSVADRCEAILSLLDSVTVDDEARGIPGLVAIIDDMFNDTKRGVTTFATVHKSKGMEASRVFILDSELMPSKYARQEWQQTQERNLQYVAITRALDTLVYVSSKKLA